MNVVSLEPLAEPANPPSFLLDWELTMKCNLDCTYCGTGLYGGHDNTTSHPPLDECLRTIDFMYTYVDQYMRYKTASLRKVVLNVYGGEALHHPNITEILQTARAKHLPYADRWALTIIVTTNAIVTESKLDQIIDLIDEFTVSYHTENNSKQKDQFKSNLLRIKQAGRRVRCVVIMHSDADLFADAQSMIAWLTQNQIAILPKSIDHPQEWNQFNYSPQQIIWFNKRYKSNTQSQGAATDLSEAGRACCSGRQLCSNQNYKSSTGFASNKFPDWYCSVNWFFLYVKQVNGELYVNKDCMMNFEGSVGPIGNLSDTDLVLDKLTQQLDTGTLPVIQCKKASCWCGLCAPKAQSKEVYQSMINKYQKGYAHE
jgi:pyruvate-formate lyase-activating enzyme